MEEETKENVKNYTFHDTVISWACIIWSIASLGFMIYFSGLNQVTFTIMTLGQLFLILGIIAIARRQSTGPVFTITGLSCIILPAINEWGYLFNDAIPTASLLPILLSTAITLIGLAMLIVPNVLENLAATRCTEKVKAEVVDLKSTTLSDDETLAFAPVYSYNYNEKVYIKSTEKYRITEVPEVGSKTELKINPKNPEDVYFEASKASKMLIYIFGSGFFISGIGMILTVLSV